jgi:hypothetical protein
MARPHKIGILGATGFDFTSVHHKVVSARWDRLGRLGDLADYDTLILNLISRPKYDMSEWEHFKSVLNVSVMQRILAYDGRIVVLGDPRVELPNDGVENDNKYSFMSWTGPSFYWSTRSGVSVDVTYKGNRPRYSTLLSKLKSYEYSLSMVEANMGVLSEIFDLGRWKENGIHATVNVEDLAVNRYMQQIAFTCRLAIMQKQKRGSHFIDDLPSRTIAVFGEITFLPDVGISEQDALTLVLRDTCGVPFAQSEPEWVTEIVPPYQQAIDDEIARVETELANLEETLLEQLEERKRRRECLRLLYDSGDTLEQAVRTVLRELGATVTDPETTEHEDGWVEVDVEGDRLRWVLEVKGVAGDQFGMDGLRQLSQWVERGAQRGMSL